MFGFISNRAYLRNYSCRHRCICKTLDYYDLERYDYDGIGYGYEFTLKKPSALYATFELEVDMDIVGHTYEKQLNGTSGISVTVLSYDNDLDDYTEYDSFDFKLGKNDTYGSYWYYTGEVLPADDYLIMISSLKDNMVAEATDCKFKLYTYSGFAKTAQMPKSATVKVGDEKKIALSKFSPSNTYCAAKWSISNKKIAKIVYREKNLAYIKGVKTGKCTLTATLKNGKKYTCKVTVKKATPKLNTNSFEIPYGSSKTLKLKNTKKKVIWSTSNSKIATVNAKGKVTAKGIGKCKITATCGGKTYTCKVKVYRLWADFTALLTDYNTRNNYFVVKFKNYGKKALTIQSNGAYCMDVDYKSYDRKLHLSGNKNITIKPNETKTVRFYVIGNTTWPDYEDFTVRYYFKYNGAKYLGSVWSTDSTHKHGKNWYATYWYEQDIYNLRGEDYI